MSERGDLCRQRSATTRTAYIRDNGLFADVNVLVQGTLFRCHRYVLALNSDLFFRLFTQQQQQPSATSVVPPVSSPGVTSVNCSTASETQSLNSETGRESSSSKSEGTDVFEAGDTLDQPPKDVDLTTASGSGEKRFFKSLSCNDGTKPSLTEEAASERQVASNENLYPVKEIRELLKPDTEESAAEEGVLNAGEKYVDRQGPQAIGSLPTVRLDFLTADSFRAVLDTVYLDLDLVTPSNVTQLYKAARRLQIQGLVQRCEIVASDLLRRHELSAGDVLLDPEMAESSTVTQVALDVLLTDFGPDSCKTEWFLGLSAENLISVLNDQRLNVRREDEVYRALKDWYAHDPQSRDRHMGRALTQIRLANLSKRILVEEILTHPLCCRQRARRGEFRDEEGGERNGREGSDVNLLGLLQRALAYHLLPDRRHDEMLRCAQFRPSQASERVLLVLGDQSDKLYGFSFARRAWFKLTPPLQALGLGVAACTYGDDLYVSGGDNAMARFWRYRPASNTWKRLKDLNVGRRSHCQVAVHSSIYVLGGKDDKQNFKRDTLDSIELLNLEDKGQGWSLVAGARLPVPVRSMAAAAVGDCVYVFGGRTNGFQVTVDVIQCFNATTQQCSLVGHLPYPSCLGRAFLAGKAVHVLQPDGNILRVRTQNLATVHQPGEVQLNLSQGLGNSTARYNGNTSEADAPEPQRSEDAPEVAQTLVDDSEEARCCGGSVDPAEEAVWKVGAVQNLNWKWFGVARSHEGTIYVVAGELGLPPAASAPALAVVVDADGSDDGGGGGGGEGGDEGAVFNGQARFIRPESMSMCYVNCHACIPKTFLVEKLA